MSVFHLKYRPQKFSDLDSVAVSKSLKKIMEGKDVPQSFLFAGPKGAGKTSAARIVARAVNCSNLENGEPCGKCDNCKEIIRGSSLDVIEIDAASNRGIEDVRALKDKAYLLPSRLAKKVFIIDEVHMLTKEAFNALLKLIEEPPVHTIFILCTTDEGKIPETVLSRLVKVSFRKGNREELKSSLKRVIEGEKVTVEEEALEMIVGKSDGSFRNLQKTFNEIFLEVGKKITKNEVENFFEGKTGEYTAEEMEIDLVEGEVKTILSRLEKMAEIGVDFKAFREELLVYFQDKLLGVYGVNDKGISKLETADLEKWLGLLIAAGKQEKEVAVDQLPLELAVVELLKNKKKSEEKKTEEPVKDKKADNVVKIKDINLALEVVEQEWGKVLGAVKPFNHSVEAFLRAARPTMIKGDRVVLEVFYPFHKDKLEEQKNREIVEDGLRAVFGMEVGFECVLCKGKAKPLVIKNDTPVAEISEKLSVEKPVESGDIYEVAKQIFG
jgi:DNA polymerase-3 subunit gamma/tau